MVVQTVGSRVRISISDPWDFVAANGSWATGRIVGLRDESAGRPPELRIGLDAPLRQEHLAASEVFARPRYRNETFERFSLGEEVTCGFSNFSDEDWGRQVPEVRMAFIGGLRLEPR
jgi:hypothetical protein